MSTVAAELQGTVHRYHWFEPTLTAPSTWISLARIEAPDSSPPNHADPGLPVEEVESIELRPIHRATEKHEALCYIERLNPASRAAQSSAVLDPSPVSIPSTEHRDVERGPPSLADHSGSNDLDTATSTIIGKCLYVLEFIIWLPYYTLFLLCMPHLYKAQVDSIIESGSDISSGVPDDAGLASFEKRWVHFVSSLSYEWKTMYLFSGVVIA
ncbi:hypothetical protein PHLCEN_2v7025 [Hermanssonia centrifuga]|uniref:Uncharacterized protein n=1 Tax=Hermanssonia centrifuga TaxID=98765 RepID=A0A2R6NXR5_9APHY|nr:hypothetical protein PHLCEN_2v7025 [Hermanssonia centrifuga]